MPAQSWRQVYHFGTEALTRTLCNNNRTFDLSPFFSGFAQLILKTASLLTPVIVLRFYFWKRQKKLQPPQLKHVCDRDVQHTEFEFVTLSLYLHSTDCISVSIVTVQGLGATYPYTWMKRSKDAEVFWLKDFLAKDFPKARILAFVYSSRWIHGADHIKMKQHGTSLLDQLRKDRENNHLEVQFNSLCSTKVYYHSNRVAVLWSSLDTASVAL
jgi:hypothetical protein